MRHHVAVGFVVACALSGAVACVDLFHSTADVLDKCEIDAASCRPLDFCALPAQTAEGLAEHACAWLGACELPVGGNAFGPCMVEARLALDCHINPNHPVIGTTHALWECLAQVQTCDAVRQCILPGPAPICSKDAGATSCVSAGSGTAIVACEGGTAFVENCALWGQSCDPSASPAVCGAGAGGGLACGPDGVPEDGAPGSCDPHTKKVYWCGAMGEVGFDCSGSGTGKCGIFPTLDSAPSWPACLPESDAACQATGSVSCAGDVATSCPAGLTETIDCARLLGAGGSCSDAGLAPPFDLTSSCLGGEACQEGCQGSTLIGCARGARFVTDCGAVGLGGCRQVTTTGDGAGPHAACSPL
jgi:hypothetical protein